MSNTPPLHELDFEPRYDGPGPYILAKYATRHHHGYHMADGQTKTEAMRNLIDLLGDAYEWACDEWCDAREEVRRLEREVEQLRRPPLYETIADLYWRAYGWLWLRTRGRR